MHPNNFDSLPEGPGGGEGFFFFKGCSTQNLYRKLRRWVWEGGVCYPELRTTAALFYYPISLLFRTENRGLERRSFCPDSTTRRFLNRIKIRLTDFICRSAELSAPSTFQWCGRCWRYTWGSIPEKVLGIMQTMQGDARKTHVDMVFLAADNIGGNKEKRWSLLSEASWRKGTLGSSLEGK